MTVLMAAGAALAVAAIAMVLTAIWSRRAGRVSVVDTSWGLVFVAISWVSLALSGGTARSALLAVLVSVWGCAWPGTSAAGPAGTVRTLGMPPSSIPSPQRVVSAGP